MIFKVPTCIIVYLPLEEIIPGKLFQKKILHNRHNLVNTLEYFFKGWAMIYRQIDL
jgi:hypothetical protein